MKFKKLLKVLSYSEPLVIYRNDGIKMTEIRYLTDGNFRDRCRTFHEWKVKSLWFIAVSVGDKPSHVSVYLEPPKERRDKK